MKTNTITGTGVAQARTTGAEALERATNVAREQAEDRIESRFHLLRTEHKDATMGGQRYSVAIDDRNVVIIIAADIQH